MSKNLWVVSLTKRIIKYRWAVLFGTILMAFAIGSGASKLGFDGDYHVFFSEENPQLKAYDDLQEIYSKDDNVLLVLTPKNGDVFTEENLAAIEHLTHTAWQTPYSSRVDAITNYQHTKAVEDDLYVNDLVENASQLTESEIAEIKDIALNEPLLVDRLINKDGSVTGIGITVKLPGEALTEAAEVTAFVRAMVDTFHVAHPDIETSMTGMIMMNNAFFESSMKDMMTLIPLMFLLVIIVIGLLTRSVSSTLATLMVIILSIVTAAGAAGYLGIKLTPPSSVFPTIVLTLAVADSIHILVSMLQFMRKGMSKNDAIAESLRINFMPVLITSVTTIIGFLAMNFGDVPPFWDLGNMTAIGMAGAFIYSILALPALMSILPVKVKVHGNKEHPTDTFLARFASFVANRPIQMAVLSGILILGVSLLALRNEFNDEFVKYFKEGIDFRDDTDYISKNLTGAYNVEFSLGSGESGGISNPTYLNDLEDFEYWLEEQPEVMHVNAYTETARRVNKSMHGDNQEYYKIPGSREEAAQYLLLYEMSLPYGLDLNNQINVDKSESRITITTENLASKQLIAFTDRAENYLVQNTPEYMHAKGTSPTLMFSHLGFRQAESMLRGNIIALILITIVLMLALRNIKIGLISIFPNVTPVFVGFGIWALFNGQINTGMVVVFGMTLGIIVDDTVHFISKFLHARRDHDYSAKQAVEYAFSTVGVALITTTIVLIAGFGVLSQSSFGMNSTMARVTSIIIFAALVIDFIFLPSLLILISPKKKTAGVTQNLEGATAEVIPELK